MPRLAAGKVLNNELRKSFWEGSDRLIQRRGTLAFLKRKEIP
jgi:hypothetical protein